MRRDSSWKLSADGVVTRHALRQPDLTAMEMSGADLDRLAVRALGTFRFFNPGHITALR
jgi:hypothetical protein